MINANIKQFEGTADGGADSLDAGFVAGAWFVKNDGSVDQTFTIGGQTVTVKSGEGLPVHVKARTATINGASGGYRVTAYESGEACPTERQKDTSTNQIADGAVTTAKLGDGALSADATGRGKMAASFFGLVAASIAHFANGFWTKAACDDKFAAGALAGTKLEDGALSADATGRSKMAAGFFGLVAASIAHFANGFWTKAACDDKFAAGSLAGTKLEDGALSADATGRAKMAAGFFGAVAASVAHFVDGFWTAAAVAAKFAAGSINHSKLQVVGVVALADADGTLTAAQLADSRIFTQTPTAGRTLTTDTAAAIIAALPGQQVGTWFDIIIVNQTGGAFDILLSPGANVTITGNATVANTGVKSGTFRVCVTGANAVVIVRMA